ncbi:hypothetical protein Egran_04368 [Elaphomyces granulatus]|uniref:Nephrocystin 3-like N-terminal domain-containing protein n=1 Tax=Elaphomyces granulatus TaxID=519963 RepID=A0A232LUL9_9EURO|nr:hypothetical protein Egran_04368 [Elaphomyces granulatus]
MDSAPFRHKLLYKSRSFTTTAAITEGKNDGLNNGLFFLNQQQFKAITEAGQARCSVDIVALHGINGHTHNTWKHENGSLWLQDFLPHQLPGARVFSFGYPAEIITIASATRRIQDFARALLEGLRAVRRTLEERSRPIIFVCHSIGGIVLKQAVVIASSDAEGYSHIHDSIIGILFLGTPHQGSEATSYPRVLINIMNAAFPDFPGLARKTQANLRNFLERDMDEIQKMGIRFRAKSLDIKIVSFIEQKPTHPFDYRLVDSVSGVVDVPGETIVLMDGCTHFDICRFENDASGIYKRISFYIEKLANVISTPSPRPPLSQEEKKCLRLLSYPEIDNRRQSIKQPQEGTCSWLFEHPNYCNWENGMRHETRDSLLCITGKPGSGKSTLLKQAFQRCHENSSRHCHATLRTAVIAFFFNSRGSKLERSPLGMFRSLLHQLLQQVHPLLGGFLPKFRHQQEVNGVGGKDWLLEDVRDYFKDAIIRQCPRNYRIIVFIDALDECDEDDFAGSGCDGDTARSIAHFFTEALSMAHYAGRDLRICLSSRHSIDGGIQDCFKLRVDDFTADDIWKYIQANLRISENQQDLAQAIIAKSSGVFLWAVLVVSKLSDAHVSGESAAELMDTLNSTPPSLSQLFTQIIDAVPDEDRQTLAQIMLWIAFAKRPLTLTELRFALAFRFPFRSQKDCEASPEFVSDDEQMERILHSRSGGLIETSKTDRNSMHIVQFIHGSVRDFLMLESRFESVDPSFGEGLVDKGHDQLTRSCVNYIKIEELFSAANNDCETSSRKLENDDNAYPFLHYAATSIFEHAANAATFPVPQTLLLQHSQPSQIPTSNCWRYYLEQILAGYGTVQTTLLHLASLYGNPACVQTLLDQGADVNAKGGLYEYPILAASRGGHQVVVQLLVEAGANVRAEDSQGTTALHWAAGKGSEAVIWGVERGERLYRDISHIERGDEEVARLLVGNGASINACQHDGQTPLHCAAKGGRETAAIAQLLLASGGDASMTDSKGATPLHQAASCGNDMMVRLLIENGADVNTKGGNGFTALYTAARKGRDTTVRTLIDKGADINTATPDTHVPNSTAAAQQRDERMKRPSLTKNRDYMKLRGGETPLHVAAKWGHVRVVKLLVENGADVHAEDQHGRTSLHWAARYGWMSVAQLLIQHGANTNAMPGTVEPQWRYYRASRLRGTPLHCAARGDHKMIVHLLLANGADVNAKDIYGRTPQQCVEGKKHHREVSRSLTPFNFGF